MFSWSTRGSDSGNRARWNKVSPAARMQVQQSPDMRITLFLIIAFHPILSYHTIENVLWFPFEGEEIDPPGAVLSIFTVTTLLSALIFPALSVTVSAVDETEDPSVLRT